MKHITNLIIIAAILLIITLMGCQKSGDPQPKKHLPEVSPISKQDSISVTVR